MTPVNFMAGFATELKHPVNYGVKLKPQSQVTVGDLAFW
jgi:hypothetical protein